MNKRILWLFVVFSLVLCLVSCSRHKNSGDDTTVALDLVFESVADCDVADYKKAFPPQYVELLASELSLIDEELDQKIREDMSVTVESREMNFGEDTYSFYTLATKEALDISTLNDGYNDYYLPNYKLDTSAVTEAYCVNVMITVGGDDDESTNRGSFVVIKIGDGWFLHPKYFFYMA